MQALLDIPPLADVSMIDEHLEALEMELELMLNAFEYAQSQNETEIVNRLIVLLAAIKPYLEYLRAAATVLATCSIDQTAKGEMQ